VQLAYELVHALEPFVAAGDVLLERRQIEAAAVAKELRGQLGFGDLAELELDPRGRMLLREQLFERQPCVERTGRTRACPSSPTK
jgi:hypothetical protein